MLDERLVIDHHAGKIIDGEVVAGEFVGKDDEEGREPGVYVTIKLRNERTAIVGGPVQITYLPMPPRPEKPVQREANPNAH